jgi:hypothetical protein
MDKMLRRLETFTARGDDGRLYPVWGYEHLARVDLAADGRDHWEPTGQAEYKLPDGRPLTVDDDGTMHLVGTGLRLRRQQ